MAIESFGTSRTILNHSIEILIRHRKLMVFPLLTLFAIAAGLSLLVAPLLLDASTTEIWHGLWHSADVDSRTVTSVHAARTAVEGIWRDVPKLIELAVLYFVGMFVLTFIRAAFCNEIIAAMNGDSVSILRGLARANSMLPAIFGWSLLSGGVGSVVRMAEDNVGFVGRWIVSLLGLSWSAASVFVIPAMLKEPRSRSPITYLRISTKLIRRVWGESVIGYMDVSSLPGTRGRSPSFWRDALLFTWAGLTAIYMMGMLADSLRMGVLAGLLLLLLLYPLAVLFQVFQCGLYVYATEGVAPGSFDPDTFDRVWTVK